MIKEVLTKAINDLNEKMEGDKYNEFHNEVFKELLKQLQEL